MIHLLPVEQRKTLEMAFFDGLTHSEIAEMTGDPLAAYLRLRDLNPAPYTHPCVAGVFRKGHAGGAGADLIDIVTDNPHITSDHIGGIETFREARNSGLAFDIVRPALARVFGLAEAEGRALIDELIAHATQRQFVYTHRWRLNDLVMWDDRCTMHRGTEFDDLRWKRDVQRATVSDVANTCEQAGIAIEAA